MLIVKVELHSAITHQVTEIARMHIINDGTGVADLGNYDVKSLYGRSAEDFKKQRITHQARVLNYPRERLHVWHLVARALERLKYGAW
jgi:hypothetical protein